MSVRLTVSVFYRNGTALLRFNRTNDIRLLVRTKVAPRGVHTQALNPIVSHNSSPSSGWQNRWNLARRAFVDNLLSRVTNSLSADLRRRTARHLMYGNSRPFFALVGVSLASGNGMLTNENQLEGVCWEIREAVGRMQKNLTVAERLKLNSSLGLKQFELGSVIAKGNNAVVYEARKIEKDRDPSDVIKQGSSNTMYPLAVKMMFNYDAESNAMSILRAMSRETVPSRSVQHDFSRSDQQWPIGYDQNLIKLSPHPNIVMMHLCFADYVPELIDSHTLYPQALPTRINPEGYGRNMSLFLVMKKYDMSLKQYLSKAPSLKIRDKILLLAQLLEAVSHLSNQNVAHRDMKTDNILLDVSEGNDVCPALVITDFGCCLADKDNGLNLPYKSADTDRGGNIALMAPEVVTARPGTFGYIDYSKADVWAVGAMAYEIFSDNNPFYSYERGKPPLLRNSTYKEEDLPAFSSDIPLIIQTLIHSLLQRSTSKRLDASFAATVCQIYLWAPSSWITKYVMPTSNEVLQWMLCLTTKVLCEGGTMMSTSSTKQRTCTEYQLITTFLHRAKLYEIKNALYWMHSIQQE
ncbi:serine/threonine-protein kinase PINK1, mitochondrial [Acyrthosiphon pisum]|uniref:non-specific serine/threonine protein kinase n=1 Tax=Acyrthosiphon pisum TaxID=7029 RepID=A0A8R2JVB6_ACYPI|nr:serine/threonine-protein kinase PINK1, mitochondrial [Acyrthosiphon pisum]|eukprot:XP_008182901.1 PREDICTED: serine/threonine-protein kinase PINK1, mitochondrial [Acyrthosiphon pisum]